MARELANSALAVARVLGAGTRRRAGPPATSTPSSAARQKASMPGRTWRWKSASCRGLRAARVDHDQRAGRGPWRSAFRTTRERGKPCDCQGFLPTNIATSARSKSRRRVAARAAEQLAVDPGLAGLLLCQRVRHVARRRSAARVAARVRAAEVVALAAAAVVEDRLAAVLVADRAQARRRPRAIAVSQSISSNVPSGRRRSGAVRRSRAFW